MGIEKVKIKKASKKDAELLAKLGSKTFSDTYAHAHSKDDMDAYLSKTFNKKKISKDLQNKDILFLLATVGEKTVGYAKLTRLKIPSSLKNQSAIELERIYIIKEMIGKKIGTELMHKSIKTAQDKGYKTMWLAVWEFNLKAQSFYKKLGFEEFGSDIFILGKTKRNLVLMKKQIA